MIGFVPRLFRRLFRGKPAAPPMYAASAPNDAFSRDAGVREGAPRPVPLREAFTPSQPKTGRRRQVGRHAELARILQALTEDRAHVVLYSERGRGKTSLSNMAVQSLRRSGTVVARHTCEAGTTFDTMMRGLMRDLPAAMLTSPATASAALDDDIEGCEAALPPGELRPRDVAALPQHLACRTLVCLIDEFDRVEDTATRTRLADTIKLISDRDIPMLFLIVGVSDNLGQILGQHPSIQRNVAGIHLPLLTDREVTQLITAGGRESGFTFQPSAIARIAVLARGMPYVAQLLGLRLTQAASARDDTQVSEDDFTSAISRMLEDTQPRVAALYAALTDHGHDTEMVQALRSISTAPQDAWGRLLVTRRDGLVQAGGRPIPAKCWDRLVEAGALVGQGASPPTGPLPGAHAGPHAGLHAGSGRSGPGSGLYTFGERLLMHYSLLLAAFDIVRHDTATHDIGRDPGSHDTVTRETGAPFEPALSRTLHVVSDS